MTGQLMAETTKRKRDSARFERRDAETEREMRRVDSPIEIRTVNEKGEIEGYGSVFNVEDSYGDIVAPGAFTLSLTEHAASGTMPAMLYQHFSSEPIGVWTAMSEDEKGLVCRGRLLLDTQRGKEVHTMLTEKAIRGLSIGFVSRKWQWNDETEQRTVLDVDLWEVSVVTFPANRAALIESVKSNRKIETIRDLERALRDAGYSKDEALAGIAAVKNSMKLKRDADSEMKSLKSSLERLRATIQGN